MTAIYTFDVFCSLDGFGSYGEGGDWGGYWGKQGPEFLDRRLAQFEEEQHLVLGANTFREFVHFLGSSAESAGGRPDQHADEDHADDGDLDDPRRPSRLAGRDPRERRRRRRRRPAQGGIRGAVALARQPVDEPRTDGRRSGRSRIQVTIFPVDHRPDRGGSDLRWCRRLRPRAAREPDAWTAASRSSSTGPPSTADGRPGLSLQRCGA